MMFPSGHLLRSSAILLLLTFIFALSSPGLSQGVTQTSSPSAPTSDAGAIPPKQCYGQCGAVFNHSFKCGLPRPPLPPKDPINGDCLCSADPFMEQTAICVDCLYRNDLETEYRVVLMTRLMECVVEEGREVCPQSCSRVFDLVQQKCGGGDGGMDIQEGGERKRRAIRPILMPNNLDPGAPAQAATPTLSTLRRILLARQNPQPEDYTCFCEAGLRARIGACSSCLLGYDAVKARDLEKYIADCDAPSTSLSSATPQPTTSETSNGPRTSTLPPRSTPLPTLAPTGGSTQTPEGGTTSSDGWKCREPESVFWQVVVGTLMVMVGTWGLRN